MENNLNEVINDIVDAEKRAENIINQAHESAKQISMVGLSEAEEAKQESAARIKDEVKKIMERASIEADKLCAERAKSAEANANMIAKTADKNIIKTVEWLAEQLTKQNS